MAQRKAVERVAKLRAAKEERVEKLKATGKKFKEEEAHLLSVMIDLESKKQKLFDHVQNTRCEIENIKLK